MNSKPVVFLHFEGFEGLFIYALSNWQYLKGKEDEWSKQIGMQKN